MQDFLTLEIAYERYRDGNMPQCSLVLPDFRTWMTWAISQSADVFANDAAEVIRRDRRSPVRKWDCRTYRLAAGWLQRECEQLRPRPDIDAFKRVPGWLSDDEAAAIQRETYGKHVLEVGTWKAKSAIAMAATAQQVVSIDHFVGDAFAGVGNPGSQAWENVIHHEAQERVSLIFSPWTVAFPLLNLRKFDVVYYDADHTYASTKAFLDCVRADAVELGMTVAVHDYDNKPQHWGCRKAVDELVADTSPQDFRIVGELAVIVY